MSFEREVYAASRRFARSDDRRAWWELIVSLTLYAGAMVAGLSSIGNWWLMVPAVVVAAAMGLRIYMIQHDCLHRSFFTSRNLNDRVGTLLSPIAMTPYRATRYIHGQHHTYVSDLERRDTFEIFTMTLTEWKSAPAWKRLQYRIYRSPVLLILIGPFVLYGVLRRMPLYGFKTGVGDLILHNLLLGGYLVLIWWLSGWGGIAFWAASFYLASVFGALIPYVVHNFEEIYWGRRPELTFKTAALEGSAVLDWGRLFDWVTMNIGYHDLHHLNAKIPGYKLGTAHAELEAEGLLHSRKIGFWQGLGCLRWKLYDEENGRMVPFPLYQRRGRVTAAE
ncbi:fatty acid desaturase [Roseibium sp. RKSG952]|uniref:fatty acid desaturase n=1 Tax=Roseibium sp. RKSG952 TaxID=2529384 RepID=UPI0012BBBAE0|nr:fatty acid desaturase [Roseibium sp. RKSG952]